MSHHLTFHAQNIQRFMLLAKQPVPTIPTIPDEKTRILRAKLILEEALETVHALGVTAFVPEGTTKVDELTFAATHAPDLVEIVDGCADVSVVTTGTLLACGVADAPVLELVDNNNLAKFGPGHSFREDGKLIKPPGHKKPDFEAELIRQGWVKP